MRFGPAALLGRRRTRLPGWRAQPRRALCSRPRSGRARVYRELQPRPEALHPAMRAVRPGPIRRIFDPDWRRNSVAQPPRLRPTSPPSLGGRVRTMHVLGDASGRLGRFLHASGHRTWATTFRVNRDSRRPRRRRPATCPLLLKVISIYRWAYDGLLPSPQCRQAYALEVDSWDVTEPGSPQH